MHRFGDRMRSVIPRPQERDGEHRHPKQHAVDVQPLGHTQARGRQMGLDPRDLKAGENGARQDDSYRLPSRFLLRSCGFVLRGDSPHSSLEGGQHFVRRDLLVPPSINFP
jgi:hypothetical protein